VTDPDPIYQDANGGWFYRCPKCRPPGFDGAFRTQEEATVAFYNHNLRRHTT
jgi:hypothetical protein